MNMLEKFLRSSLVVSAVALLFGSTFSIAAGQIAAGLGAVTFLLLSLVTRQSLFHFRELK